MPTIWIVAHMVKFILRLGNRDPKSWYPRHLACRDTQVSRTLLGVVQCRMTAITHGHSARHNGLKARNQATQGLTIRGGLYVQNRPLNPMTDEFTYE